MCDAFAERDVAVLAVVAVAAAAAAAQIVRPAYAALLLLSWASLTRGGFSELGYYGARPLLTVAALIVAGEPAAWLHGAAVGVATALSPRCDRTALSVAADLTALPFAWFMLAEPRREYRSWCAVEALLVLGLLLAENDELADKASHLTWWNLFALGLYDAAVVAERGRALAPAVLVLCGVVVAGVLYMSAVQCDMLQNSYDDVGAGVYFAGNFAMHYYPAARLVFAPWPTNFAPALVRAVAFVTIYSLLYDVVEVYGCAEPPAAAVPLLMTGVAAAIAMAAAVAHAFAKHLSD